MASHPGTGVSQEAFEEPAHGDFRGLSRFQGSACEGRKSALECLLDLRGVWENRRGKAWLNVVLGFGQAGDEAEIRFEGTVRS